MFCSHSAAVPSELSRAARCCLIGVALLLAGCASKPPMASPARVNTSVQTAKVEIEDDGLPAQVAPRYRRSSPDDPSQPWSPNYGGPNYGSSSDVVVLPADEPRRVRYRTDAEALAAARSRLATMATQPTPAPGRAVQVLNAPPARPPAEPPPVRYASDAEALAAARSRLAAMAAQAAPSPGSPVQVLNAPDKPSAARLSGVDEDALVRRAIAEHEMRRRD